VADIEYPDDTSKMSTHDLGIHLPPPSIYPIFLALAMAIFFGGFMVHWAVSAVSAVAIALLVFAMAFEPGHSH
jgi:cytochrome c oxidase subunit 1